MKLNTLIATAALLATGVAGAQELVVDGGFENPPVPAGAPYLLNINPVGWVGAGDLAVQGYGGSVPSGDGNQWLDLNPGFDAGTGISQVISFAAGSTYHFSFLFNGGGANGTDGTTTQIAFAIGSLLAGSVATGAMNVYAGTPWGVYAADFTAAVSGAQTLSFVPNGVWYGGFIDAVSVQAVNPAVPEPSAAWLLLAGLVAIPTLRRMTRDRTAD